MANYTASDKLLHKMYLSNYAISKATLEMEELIYGSKAKQKDVTQLVFVTGLARSGTTAIMRELFKTDEFASLQYSNMPFLLSPNFWNRHSKVKAHERAHKDGILVDGNSPEEFDEYFWKAFLNDSYIGEHSLSQHEIEDALLSKYKSYVSLICLAKGKNKYISKNNNNVLRLSSLRRIENHKIVLLFRHPVAHASSLMKLDISFSKTQREDSFSLDYFNYLGHHEFGLNHKPFLLTEEFNIKRSFLDSKERTIDYWLAIWLNYYSFILSQKHNNDIIICFENLIEEPRAVYGLINEELNIHIELDSIKKHRPSEYPTLNCDAKLLEKCLTVYEQLVKLSNRS